MHPPSPPSPLEEIFFTALQKGSSAERAAYLDEACADDLDLREHVEKMLAAQAQAGSFLEAPIGELGKTMDQAPLACLGTQIGPYKLLQQIGEGGMGVVYMAEQKEPVERRVALKIIKPGMDTRQVVARFEAERQALAMMDHPNIAKVLDAGATDGGRPYFVMELVRGVPITQYCDEHHRTPKERLELFLPVLQAVQHAHQKGIIHRDIKPTNVLVAEYDDRPVPKVIDFGVAKATSQKLTEKTMFTQFGQLVGTLDYMSPEQAKLNEMDIDTRSDIYSLGVLLYELLTGDTPFDRQRLRSAAFEEMMRIIREEEPPKPSTRLSSSTTLASVSANRNTEPKKLSTLVRGELDWIVMKALDKDRGRRYETANGFAADLQRYLDNEPVEACRPSAAYRLRKLVQRNRVALGVTAFVAVTLVVATLVSTWQAVRAREALRSEAAARTDAEAASTKEAAQRMIAEQRRIEADEQRAEADRQRQQAVANLQKAREAVDQMLTRVSENRLSQVPQMEAVRKALLEDALKFYQEFLQLKSSDPSVRLGTGLAWGRVARIYKELGQFDEAYKASEEAIAMFEKLVAEFPSEPSYRTALVGSYADLGFLLGWNVGAQEIGSHRTAEGLFGQALALEEALLTEFPHLSEQRSMVWSLNIGLGTTLQNMGLLDDAEKALRRAVAISEDPGNRLEQDKATSYFRLGNVLKATQRLQEAEQALRQALTIQERMVNEKPADRWTTHLLSDINLQLAEVLQLTSRTKEAEDRYRSALAISQKLAADFPKVRWQRAHLATVQLHLGQVLAHKHRVAEAEQLYHQANATMEALAAEGQFTHYWCSLLVMSQNRLADLLNDSGRIDESEQVHREAISCFEQLVSAFPEDRTYQRELASSQSRWAGFLTQQESRQNSEEAYRQSIETWQQLVATYPDADADRRDLAETHFSLGRVLWTAGRPQEAEDQYQEGLDIQERLAQDPGFSAERRLQWAARYLELGHALAAAGHPNQAEAAYRRCVAITEQVTKQEPWAWEHLGGAVNNLGVFLAATGQYEEAEQLFRKSLDLQQKVVERTPERDYSRQELAGSYYNLGLLLEADDRSAEAEQAFSQALPIWQSLVSEVAADGITPQYPGVSRVHQGLTATWVHGRPFLHTKLANMFDRLAELAEKRGEAAEAQRLLEQAIDSHQAALESNPSDPHYRRYVLNNYARTIQHFIRSHHEDDAQPEQQSAPRGIPDIWEDYYRAAGALAGCGSDVPIDADVSQVESNAWSQVQTASDQELLKQVFRRSARHPATPLEQNNLAWLLATHPVLEVRDPPRAIELAKQAVAAAPEQAPSWYTLGVAHYRAGDWNATIEALERSGSLAPGQSQAFNAFFLAMAHWQLGNKDEARKWYEQAVAWMEKSGPEDAELLRFRQEAAELLVITETKAETKK